MIRDLVFGDLDELRKFPIDFPFPDLASGLYCSQKALLDPSGKLIGSAMLKLTSEAILILDPNVSNLTKALVISEAFKTVPEELTKFGLDQVHVFIVPESDTRYVELLKKSFQFEKAKGIPLVYTRK